MNEYEDVYERFDVAESLTSEEAIAEYLRLSQEEDSPEDFAEALVDAARARARLAKANPDVPPEAIAGFCALLGLAKANGYNVTFTPATTGA